MNIDLRAGVRLRLQSSKRQAWYQDDVVFLCSKQLEVMDGAGEE